jgi:hypothetical protein
MKKLASILLLFLGIVSFSIAQTDVPSQTVKGFVLDKDSQQPLIGATVYVSNLEDPIGTTTDIDGSFRIENVPIGRRDIVCEYIGYSTFFAEGIILNSAKELDLNIELIESVIQATDSIAVVYGNSQKTNRPLNDMNIISSRSFSVEEAQKYPGSIADPSRMALGFAGVQMGQDNNNDIVVRSNSSIGVLWRLEGVEIINPNHFARRGGSGGGISAFSGSVLSNSDFSTGAFAPEYGNAFAGVFDMKFRKGNRDKQEYTIKAGLLGLDFATEGPIKKGRSSYLFNYRYSTLGILNAAGLHVVDARTTNNFQDLSFNTYFPSKDNKTIVQIWGIGGLSTEIQEPEMEEEWSLFDDQTRYNFVSNMGTVGLSLSRILENNSYIKTVLSASANKITWDRDSVDLDLNRSKIEDEKYINGRYDLTSFYNKKFNSKVNIKTGVSIKNIFFDLERAYHSFSDDNFVTDLNQKGNTWQLQYYFQTRYRPTDKLTITGGLHTLFFTLNNTYSVEPRLGMKYQIAKNASLTLAYGMHSQIVPIGTYFIYDTDVNGNKIDNQDLDLLKAQHLVLGYDHSFKKNIHLNVELYYQHLYNVPIINDGTSTFWMLNVLEGYGKKWDNPILSSDGKGRNLGMDITFEKYLSNNLFFLISGSVFSSTYTIDGLGTFNTRYNGRYSSSFMVGKEFTLKKNNSITFSIRNLYNGGLRYTPGDAVASEELGDLVEDESQTFQSRLKDYWRIDFQLAYRKDKPKYAWSIILDTQNIIDRDNQRELIYDYNLNDFIFKKQSGFVPVLSFQVDF